MRFFKAIPEEAHAFRRGSFTPIQWTWHGFFWLALAGIISTGIGYLCFNLALERLRVHQVGIFDLVIGTLLGVLLSVFAFHETLTWNVALGGFLLVGSGAFFLRKQHLLNVRLKLPLTRKAIYGTGFLQKKTRGNH